MKKKYFQLEKSDKLLYGIKYHGNNFGLVQFYAVIVMALIEKSNKISHQKRTFNSDGNFNMKKTKNINTLIDAKFPGEKNPN